MYRKKLVSIGMILLMLVFAYQCEESDEDYMGVVFEEEILLSSETATYDLGDTIYLEVDATELNKRNLLNDEMLEVQNAAYFINLELLYMDLWDPVSVTDRFEIILDEGELNRVSYDDSHAKLDFQFGCPMNEGVFRIGLVMKAAGSYAVCIYDNVNYREVWYGTEYSCEEGILNNELADMVYYFSDENIHEEIFNEIDPRYLPYYHETFYYDAIDKNRITFFKVQKRL